MKYLFLLILLTFNSLVFAKGELKITSSDKEGIQWINLAIENISPVYGMELELTYSPKELSIFDGNSKKNGIQITSGAFFSEDAYEISNNIDQKQGRIRYAISLLKPQKDVSGSGDLTSIGFKTRTDKASTVEIKTVKFGTQQGKVVTVKHPNNFSVQPAKSIPSSSKTNNPFEPKTSTGSLIESMEEITLMHVLLLLVIVLLVITIIILIRKK